MIWMTDKPQVPGWYWYRACPAYKATVEKVYQYWLSPPHGGKYVLVTTSQHTVEHLEGEWAGPIPLPDDRVPSRGES